MLKFRVLDNGQTADDWDLRNAYLIGSDGNAMRAEISYHDRVIQCEKRESGLAALALQHRVGECGELTVQTCLLPEREAPYLLNLELARHQLMQLYTKLEDWNLFDLPTEHPAARRADRGRKLFIEAVNFQDTESERAEKLAQESLINAIDGSEELALAHAVLLLEKRKSNRGMPRYPIGCGVHTASNGERIRAGLAANFDFVHLPLSWRRMAPEESDYQWSDSDNWVEWVDRERIPVVAGPVVNFESHALPDWLYIWEHDYDTLRDLIYEHIDRVVKRYGGVIATWNVVSGLHVNSNFSFNFDQIMDLTRMSTLLIKERQPNAKVLVELRQPFGEYYGDNQRSIPPLMYADLLVQSAVNFDGFSIKLLMGQALPGQYTRDLMQISCMLDQFSHLGKPITLTIAVPSEMVTQIMRAPPDASDPIDPNCGYWRKPWSVQVQSHWLEALFKIALSKPHVDSVAWHDLVDHDDIELPMAGLVSEDQQPKGAFRRLVNFRRSLQDSVA